MEEDMNVAARVNGRHREDHVAAATYSANPFQCERMKYVTESPQQMLSTFFFCRRPMNRVLFQFRIICRCSLKRLFLYISILFCRKIFYLVSTWLIQSLRLWKMPSSCRKMYEHFVQNCPLSSLLIRLFVIKHYSVRSTKQSTSIRDWMLQLQLPSFSCVCLRCLALNLYTFSGWP